MILRKLVAMSAVATLLAPVVPMMPGAHAQTTRPAPSFDVFSQRFFNDVQQAGQVIAVDTLARWISTSRADAIQAGVSPIPQSIRTQLKGHFPEAMLDKVRYRVGMGSDFSLQTKAFQGGNAVAITLDDVILFRSADDAARNIELWAHELHHVRQYQSWGVTGFAQRYTRDHRAVEAEAYAEAARIKAAIGKAG